MIFMKKVAAAYTVKVRADTAENVPLVYDADFLKNEVENNSESLQVYGWYRAAISKIKKALSAGKKLEFYLDAPSSFGGILYVKIANENIQVSKKKLRLNDAKGFLTGKFW